MSPKRVLGMMLASRPRPQGAEGAGLGYALRDFVLLGEIRDRDGGDLWSDFEQSEIALRLGNRDGSKG